MAIGHGNHLEMIDNARRNIAYVTDMAQFDTGLPLEAYQKLLEMREAVENLLLVINDIQVAVAQEAGEE